MAGNCRPYIPTAVIRDKLATIALRPASAIDYADPTKGVAAMRVRILRAEILAGCAMSVFDAETDGEKAVTAIGPEIQPRATPAGAWC